MADDLAQLHSDLQNARAQRDRLDQERAALGLQLRELVARADAAGLRTGAIAAELGISDQAVRDLRRGRYGTGRPRGRPAAN